uniref:Uncharacterized protein n=1 Tax=Neospora caninum (strain Liverpool) TaxID=572307 RepID=A0A0F7U6I3_NEOCL|nr:TPA: hypothetical protein BN1204_012625 [Neospora caninum Liverpool]
MEDGSVGTDACVPVREEDEEHGIEKAEIRISVLPDLFTKRPVSCTGVDLHSTAAQPSSSASRNLLLPRSGPAPAKQWNRGPYTTGVVSALLARNPGGKSEEERAYVTIETHRSPYVASPVDEAAWRSVGSGVDGAEAADLSTTASSSIFASDSPSLPLEDILLSSHQKQTLRERTQASSPNGRGDDRIEHTELHESRHVGCGQASILRGSPASPASDAVNVLEVAAHSSPPGYPSPSAHPGTPFGKGSPCRVTKLEKEARPRGPGGRGCSGRGSGEPVSASRVGGDAALSPRNRANGRIAAGHGDLPAIPNPCLASSSSLSSRFSCCSSSPSFDSRCQSGSLRVAHDPVSPCGSSARIPSSLVKEKCEGRVSTCRSQSAAPRRLNGSAHSSDVVPRLKAVAALLSLLLLCSIPPGFLGWCFCFSPAFRAGALSCLDGLCPISSLCVYVAPAGAAWTAIKSRRSEHLPAFVFVLQGMCNLIGCTYGFSLPSVVLAATNCVGLSFQVFWLAVYVSWRHPPARPSNPSSTSVSAPAGEGSDNVASSLAARETVWSVEGGPSPAASRKFSPLCPNEEDSRSPDAQRRVGLSDISVPPASSRRVSSSPEGRQSGDSKNAWIGLPLHSQETTFQRERSVEGRREGSEEQEEAAGRGDTGEERGRTRRICLGNALPQFPWDLAASRPATATLPCSVGGHTHLAAVSLSHPSGRRVSLLARQRVEGGEANAEHEATTQARIASDGEVRRELCAPSAGGSMTEFDRQGETSRPRQGVEELQGMNALHEVRCQRLEATLDGQPDLTRRMSLELSSFSIRPCSPHSTPAPSRPHSPVSTLPPASGCGLWLGDDSEASAAQGPPPQFACSALAASPSRTPSSSRCGRCVLTSSGAAPRAGSPAVVQSETSLSPRHSRGPFCSAAADAQCSGAENAPEGETLNRERRRASASFLVSLSAVSPPCAPSSWSTVDGATATVCQGRSQPRFGRRGDVNEARASGQQRQGERRSAPFVNDREEAKRDPGDYQPWSSILFAFARVSAAFAPLCLFLALLPVSALGVLLTVFNVLTAVSPLSLLGNMIRRRSSLGLPRPLVSMTVVCNCLWGLYGLAADIPAISISSFIGYEVGLVHLTVLLWCDQELGCVDFPVLLHLVSSVSTSVSKLRRVRALYRCCSFCPRRKTMFFSSWSTGAGRSGSQAFPRLGSVRKEGGTGKAREETERMMGGEDGRDFRWA